MEEIYICTQYLKNFTYSDVLNMPIYERRFYLGLLTKEQSDRQAQMEVSEEQQKTKGARGNRTSKVGGQALKNKIKGGDLPLS